MIDWAKAGAAALKWLAMIIALAAIAAACASDASGELDSSGSAVAVVQPTATQEPTVAEPTAIATTPPAATAQATPQPQPEPTPSPAPAPTSTSVPLPDYECRLDAVAPGPISDLELAVEIVAEGLEVPWGLAILPSGNLLVTERPGRVRLVDPGGVIAEPVLELPVELPPPLFGRDRLGPEGGLLGVSLHPDFATNRQFYLFYNIRPEPDRYAGRIERYVLASDDRSAELDQVIIDDLPAGVHHQGGRMKIGPDAMLYVGVGAFEPEDAQDPGSLAGKLLRLDLDGGIPVDNPDPSSYVFISGIRNSQGFDWIDDDTLIVVDHGPSGLELNMPDLRGFDEVNIARAGDNLGWPRVWGCDATDGVSAPVLTWNNSVPPTGGAVYRHDAIPEWDGHFLFSTVGRDFGRHLHSIEVDIENPAVVVSHEVHLFGEYGRLRTVVPDEDGGVYVMTSNCDNRGVCPPQGDVILRITAAG